MHLASTLTSQPPNLPSLLFLVTLLARSAHYMYALTPPPFLRRCTLYLSLASLSSPTQSLSLSRLSLISYAVSLSLASLSPSSHFSVLISRLQSSPHRLYRLSSTSPIRIKGQYHIGNNKLHHSPYHTHRTTYVIIRQ